MIEKKYINPVAYLVKGKQLLAKLLLQMGVSIRVVTTIDGFPIVFVANNYLEYLFRAEKSYQRERVTMHWLRNIVNSTDIVYDVGANVGAYSLFAGHKVKSGGGQVYAFEPAFFNFSSLSRNIEANQLSNIVIPYSVALGNSCCEGKFYLSSTIAGSALHGLGQPVSEGNTFETQFLQGVYVTTLDEFTLNHGVAFPNHIKIDVDGSESDIVSGMQLVMTDHRLKSVMIEINTDISKGQVEIMINNCGLKEEMSEQWNGKNTYNKLFVRH